MKIDILPYNDKGEKHGYWEKYHSNGDLMYKCFYVNGRLNGYDEDYFLGKNEICLYL